MVSISISTSTMQTLLVLIGPFIYTKARALYRASKIPLPPVPLPRTTGYFLNILFLSALVGLVSTLPYFMPENIFLLTSSQLLQTPTDLVFTRLSKLRDLTPADDLLRARLRSKDGRLLYAQFGPGPMTHCDWCLLDDASTWALYALPDIAWPHLLHIGVLGLVTSGGGRARTWRTVATLAGIALAAVEVWMTILDSSAFGKNLRGPEKTVWTAWRVRQVRGIGIALVDAFVGYVVWLTATRRWGVGWDGAVQEEQWKTAIAALERSVGKLQAQGWIRGAVMRNENLRAQVGKFWEGREKMAVEEIEREELVRDRKEWETRPEFEELKRQARECAEGVVQSVMREREMERVAAELREKEKEKEKN